MKEEYWTTRSGERIAVSNLTIEHLRNIVRRLIRTKRNNEVLNITGDDYCDKHLIDNDFNDNSLDTWIDPEDWY